MGFIEDRNIILIPPVFPWSACEQNAKVISPYHLSLLDYYSGILSGVLLALY